MKKNKVSQKRRRQIARAVLKDILDYYPIAENKALAIAGVTLSTWRRWKAGTANPPAAVVELIRLHALGEPPDAAFKGFRFAGGLFYDDMGGKYSPGEIRTLSLYRAHSCRYLALLRQIEGEKRAENLPPPKTALYLIK